MKNYCHLQPSEQGGQLRKSHWLASLKISRTMKLSVLFFVGSLGISYASGTSYAQTAMVSVESQNATVGEVLKDIENQSDFDFFYNNNQIDLNRRVSVSSRNSDIFNVLDQMFAGTNVSYSVLDKNIILSTKEMGRHSVRQASRYTLKGKVTDAKGEPVIGATVLEVGTTNGSVTDIDGNFTLNLSKSTAKVEISYIGYKKEILEAKAGSPLKVILKEDTEVLDEVVVTALGIKREQKALSYNVQQIKNEEITTVKDANFMSTLSGKVAGVNINTSAAGTGAPTRVVMRGIKSISSNNNALYVIDGVPIFNNNQGTANDEYAAQPTGEGISDLNPDDIENISVLSGPAAAALYGSSAAQGVILITTKKGDVGKTKLEYSNNTTFSKPFILPKFQNEYANRPGEFASWGEKNSRYRYDPADFFETGSNVSNSVTLTTGTQRNQTFLSAAANNSQGMLPNNDYNRYNFTIRNTTKFLNDKMTLDLGASYILQNQKNMVSQGLYYNPIPALYLYPRGEDFDEVRLFEEFDEGRNIYVQRWDWGNQGMSLENPYWEMNRKIRKNNRQRYMFNASLKYDILSWLNVTGRVRIDNVYSKGENQLYATTDTYWTQGSLKGSYNISRTEEKQAYADLMLNINKSFKNFSVNAVIGTNFTQTSREGNGFGGPLRDMPNFFNVYNVDKNIGGPSQSGWQERQFAWFGSAEVGYKSMLYLTVTARNEWASQLANTEQPCYFFPSVGLSGVISEMVKMPDFITYLKVRGSYADVGSPIPRGLSQPGYTWNNQTQSWNPPSYRPIGKLYPEKTSSWEAGVNARLFDNHVNVDVTWYLSDTKNQTFNVSTSAATGYASMYLQAGCVRNTGMEIAVGYHNNWGGFGWNTNVTYSYNRNKIRELLENYYDPLSNEYYSIEALNKPGTRLMKGGSIGDIYTGYEFKRDQEGYIWIDPNTKNVVKEQLEEPKKIGSFLPKGNLGWNNTFSYKGISLSTLITARLGGQVVSMTQAYMDFYGVSEASAQARDAGGIPVNNKTVDPEGYYQVVGGRTPILGEYVYDATNVRLQELSLAYNLPKSWFGNKLNMTVSFIGRNLWMIYNKAPFDPESTASTGTYNQGKDYFMQPSQRNIGFGLKLQF